MRKNRVTAIVSTIVIFGFCFIRKADAVTETFFESGQSCKPDLWSNQEVSWGGKGKQNTSYFNSGLVVCPIPWKGTLPVIAADTAVYYYDGNPYPASSQYLHCTASAYTDTGALWYGATRYSCADPGGCVSGANYHHGAGFLLVEGLDLVSGTASYSILCQLPDIEFEHSGIYGYKTTFSWQ